MALNDILINTLSHINIVLRIFGILAWTFAIAFFWLKIIKKNQNILPSALLIRLLDVLAHRSITWLLLIGAFQMPLSFLFPTGIYQANELKILFYAIFCATGILFLIGHKGLGIPLGEGLIMTVDKHPKFSFPVSKRVISFHVDKNFPKKRRTITNKIVHIVNVIKTFDDKHDFVLKSWIFSNRDNADQMAVNYIRARMHKIRQTVKFCALVFLLLLSLALYASLHEDYSSLNTLFNLFFADMIATTLITALIIYFIRKKMQTLCTNANTTFTTKATHILSRELTTKTIKYKSQIITPYPMPVFHIISFSLIEKDVIKDCVGIETGFVLIRR